MKERLGLQGRGAQSRGEKGRRMQLLPWAPGRRVRLGVLLPCCTGPWGGRLQQGQVRAELNTGENVLVAAGFLSGTRKPLSVVPNWISDGEFDRATSQTGQRSPVGCPGAWPYAEQIS